ncbi:MAG: sulfite exporter TauE/SafE family protein [Candidatus Vogelbacteria bacterium]|nr:sulfite exporter TauE/SafE family protein [Candidatus Vogelbacteria bacterium]
MTEITKKYTFHVGGMHCKSCEVVTESEIKDLSEVTNVKSNLSNHTVTVEGNFGDKSKEEIADKLNAVLAKHKYTVSTEGLAQDKKWHEFKIAIPVAIIFAVVFVLLQKAGLVNIISTGDVTYGTAFVIGVVASLSSCMAVVGGLVLSMSATFAQEGDKVRPQLMFHGGRLAAFFVLGGVIGAIGSAFALNTTATIILGIIIGVVMLILGINLLNVFHWAKRLQPAMPRFLSKHAMGVTKFNHTITPMLVGIVTFFLPCGFTQSMQIYTLSTGNFMTGALTMFFFALGTLPVLALLSFSSFSIHNSSKSGVFFKSAGLIVIMFALLNIVNSLVIAGLIAPVFNF